MTEILNFNTWEDAKAEINVRKGVWRPLQHNLINNIWEIVFVNGLDDPDNDPIQVAKRLAEKTRFERMEALKTKIQSGTILPAELIEYIRLRDIP